MLFRARVGIEYMLCNVTQVRTIGMSDFVVFTGWLFTREQQLLTLTVEQSD